MGASTNTNLSADFCYILENAITMDTPFTIEKPKELTQVLIEITRSIGRYIQISAYNVKEKQSQLWNCFPPNLPNQILNS